MKSSDAPSKQSVPFGVNGSRQSILDTTPTGSNAASYDVGFPPITMILKSAGGLPPLGQNWNQILYELSGISRFLSAGGGYVYDSTFSTAVGGYPAGAVIPNSTLNGLWINTVDDNTTNPENNTAALTGWVPAFSYGATSFTGLTSSSVTVGTLDASKDVITLTGLLTANINLVLPAWIKKWDIVNNTTGAFTVTVKTPSGNGVAISSGMKVPVIGDGTNINTNYAPGALIKRTEFFSSGTFIPQAGTKTINGKGVGGGGAGGGVGASQSTTVRGGGGGGSGTYGEFTTTNISTQTVTIGNGGTPASGGDGGNGSATSFGTIASFPGGNGGGLGIQVTGAARTAGGGSQSTVSTGTTMNVTGQAGDDSFAVSNQTVVAGRGASNPLGTGGQFFVATSSTGAAFSNNGASGTGYGSGGAGATCGIAGAANTGGSGAKGYLVIEERA